MDTMDGFIAVDWGTTNRRAYLIDGSGACLQEFEDAKGILSIERGGFDAAVEEIRERLGRKPLLMAGMVGSDRGWVEARYVSCPAALEDLARYLVWVADDAAIVPGVAYDKDNEADVMRGEEVQLLGAVADGLVPGDALVCHPGTHNKWVELSGKRINSFRTVMTGELFNLLREHSILSGMLGADVNVGDAFRAGVTEGLDPGDVLAELFRVRARVLLGKLSAEDAASFTSGLLIGSDVRTGLSGTPECVRIMGRPELTRLYAEAVRAAGAEAVELDGEACFIAGIRKIAEMIS